MSAEGGAETAVPAPDGGRWLVLFGIWLVYLCFGMISVSLAPVVAPITRDLGLTHGAMGSVLGVWQLVYIAAAIPCGTLLDRLGARRALFIGAIDRRRVRPGARLRHRLLDAAAGGRSVRHRRTDHLLRRAQGGGAAVHRQPARLGDGDLHHRPRDRVGDRAVADQRRGDAVAGPGLAGVLLLWSLFAFAGAGVWLLLSLHPAARRLDTPAGSGPRPKQTQVVGDLLKLPAVRLLLLMAVGIFSFNHGLNNWLPELLRHGGMSATAAGFWATLPTVVGIVGSLLIPRLATPDRRFTLLAGLGLAAMAASLLLDTTSAPLLTLGLVLQGIARSSLMTVAILTLVETRGVGERHAGTASGLFFSFAEIGGAGGPIVLGVLYDATGGFDAGLYLLAGIGALLAVAAMGLRRIGR